MLFSASAFKPPSRVLPYSGFVNHCASSKCFLLKVCYFHHRVKHDPRSISLKPIGGSRAQGGGSPIQEHSKIIWLSLCDAIMQTQLLIYGNWKIHTSLWIRIGRQDRPTFNQSLASKRACLPVPAFLVAAKHMKAILADFLQGWLDRCHLCLCTYKRDIWMVFLSRCDCMRIAVSCSIQTHADWVGLTE